MHQKNKKRFQWLVVSLVVGAAIVAILQGGPLDGSLEALNAANFSQVVLAVIVFIAHFLCAAGTYYFLAARRLRYAPTLLIAVSGAFAGKLLPAGAGGITLYFLYLRRQRFGRPQAAGIIATNNTIGIAMHLSLLVVAIVGAQYAELQLPSAGQLTAVLSGLAAVSIVVYIVSHRPKTRRRIQKAFREFVKQIRGYRRRPALLGLAMVSALGITLTYTACLYFSLHALGAAVSPFTALVVFTVGIAATGLSPTPGGLGAIEASMVAVVIGLGIAAGTAIAAVLVYRLISFWVPFGIGACALLLARRRALI